MHPRHVTFPAETKDAILDVVRERARVASGRWYIHSGSIPASTFYCFPVNSAGDLPRRCNAERTLERSSFCPGPFLDFPLLAVITRCRPVVAIGKFRSCVSAIYAPRTRVPAACNRRRCQIRSCSTAHFASPNKVGQLAKLIDDILPCK